MQTNHQNPVETSPVDSKACACRNHSEHELVDSFRGETGELPKPIKLMLERPGTLEAFACYRGKILDSGPLSERECALVHLATAAALRSPHCISRAAKRAQNIGISKDEIVQLVLIVGLHTGTSLLNSAHQAID